MFESSGREGSNHLKTATFTNFFSKTNKYMSDLDRQIEQLKRFEILKESEVKALCTKAREILIDESNVQKVIAAEFPHR